MKDERNSIVLNYIATRCLSVAERKIEGRPEPKLREAAARTAEALQTLRSRLRRESAAQNDDSPDDLGRQLSEYFAESVQSSAGPSSDRLPDDLRELVIQSVVERVLLTWSDPNSGLSGVREEVITRLVERVLGELKHRK